MNEKTNTLVIRTPEGISFSLLLAGPVTRSLAWIIDMACISATSSVFAVALSAAGVVSVDFSRALIILGYFLISVGYGIVAEWYWRGQTLGKRLLRLRVIDAQGMRLQPSQIVIRNLMRFVDSLPLFYALGGTACLISRYAQRLGDLAANTIVVRNPEISDPDLEQLLSGKYNSLREHPHLASRLRQRVGPPELSIGVQALLRRDELMPEARVELFREIAAHFQSLVEFPDEAVYGMTDEQYVRNVMDVVFSSNRVKQADRHSFGSVRSG